MDKTITTQGLVWLSWHLTNSKKNVQICFIQRHQCVQFHTNFKDLFSPLKSPKILVMLTIYIEKCLISKRKHEMYRYCKTFYHIYLDIYSKHFKRMSLNLKLPYSPVMPYFNVIFTNVSEKICDLDFRRQSVFWCVRDCRAPLLAN